MLTVVRLGHLQTEFQIFRLLERSCPSWTASVLKVAAEIITLIIELGNRRINTKVLHHDFSYIVKIAQYTHAVAVFSDITTDTELWLTCGRCIGYSGTQLNPQRRCQHIATVRIASCDVDTKPDRLCLATRKYSRANRGQLRYMFTSVTSDFADS